MRKWKYHVRKLFMLISKRDCDTCNHYDGRFGEDCCFECERSIKAKKYERRRSERIL